MVNLFYLIKFSRTDSRVRM